MPCLETLLKKYQSHYRYGIPSTILFLRLMFIVMCSHPPGEQAFFLQPA